MSENFDLDDFKNQLQGEKITMKQERFELVSAYLDGEVTPSQRREVEALLVKDPVAKHLYQRLLQLRSEFQRMPITPTLETVDRTVEQVFEKIDRRSKRTFIWCGSAITALCIAVISGIISATRSPVIQLVDEADTEPVQIALNEPIIEIVNPNNNVMLTINEPLFQIPQPSVTPLEN